MKVVPSTGISYLDLPRLTLVAYGERTEAVEALREDVNKWRAARVTEEKS